MIHAPPCCCHLKPFNSSLIPIRNGIPSLPLSSIPFSLNNTFKNLGASEEGNGNIAWIKRNLFISCWIKQPYENRLGKLLADTLGYYYYDSLIAVIIWLWKLLAVKTQQTNLQKWIKLDSVNQSFEAIIVNVADGCFCWRWCCSECNKLVTFKTWYLDLGRRPLDIIAKEIVEDGVRLIGTSI